MENSQGSAGLSDETGTIVHKSWRGQVTAQFVFQATPGVLRQYTLSQHMAPPSSSSTIPSFGWTCSGARAQG